jgi:hypothetical protein
VAAEGAAPERGQRSRKAEHGQRKRKAEHERSDSTTRETGKVPCSNENKWCVRKRILPVTDGSKTVARQTVSRSSDTVIVWRLIRVARITWRMVAQCGLRYKQTEKVI